MPRLAVAASLGVLLVAAFAAGRVWDRPRDAAPAIAVADETLSERLLRAEVEDHLERSQRMLVELVNADYADRRTDRGRAGARGGSGRRRATVSPIGGASG